MKSERKGHKEVGELRLTRKEWLRKSGKYTAFTAAAMMLILDSPRAQDKSTADPPR